MSFLEKLGYTMEIECENDCQTKISPMKELKSVLDQEKVCHHLVQIHLSSHLLCRSIIKLYKTIFFMNMKLGLFHLGQNIDYGQLRTGC